MTCIRAVCVAALLVACEKSLRSQYVGIDIGTSEAGFGTVHASSGDVNIIVGVRGSASDQFDQIELVFEGQPPIPLPLSAVSTYVWHAAAHPEGSYRFKARVLSGGYWFDSITIQILVDRTPPRIVSFLPAPGTTALPRDTIRITFDEPTQGRTTSIIVTQKSNGVPLPCSVVTVDGNTVACGTIPAISGTDEVHVRVDTSVTDLAGNPLVDPLEWNFSIDTGWELLGGDSASPTEGTKGRTSAFALDGALHVSTGVPGASLSKLVNGVWQTAAAGVQQEVSSAEFVTSGGDLFAFAGGLVYRWSDVWTAVADRLQVSPPDNLGPDDEMRITDLRYCVASDGLYAVWSAFVNNFQHGPVRAWVQSAHWNGSTWVFGRELALGVGDRLVNWGRLADVRVVDGVPYVLFLDLKLPGTPERHPVLRLARMTADTLVPLGGLIPSDGGSGAFFGAIGPDLTVVSLLGDNFLAAYLLYSYVLKGSEWTLTGRLTDYPLLDTPPDLSLERTADGTLWAAFIDSFFGDSVRIMHWDGSKWVKGGPLNLNPNHHAGGTRLAIDPEGRLVASWWEQTSANGYRVFVERPRG